MWFKAAWRSASVMYSRFTWRAMF